MNIILLFFILPLATIILSIVLQKILRNAFLTAATFFAIYLILAFTAFDESFLVFAIAYTIISYITAVIAEIFFRNKNCCNCRNCCNSRNCCNCRNCFTCMNNTNNDVSAINDNRQNLINPLQLNGNVASNAQNNSTNGRPNTIAVNVRDPNNESNSSRWCCYRR